MVKRKSQKNKIILHWDSGTEEEKTTTPNRQKQNKNIQEYRTWVENVLTNDLKIMCWISAVQSGGTNDNLAILYTVCGGSALYHKIHLKCETESYFFYEPISHISSFCCSNVFKIQFNINLQFHNWRLVVGQADKVMCILSLLL